MQGRDLLILRGIEDMNVVVGNASRLAMIDYQESICLRLGYGRTSIISRDAASRP